MSLETNRLLFHFKMTCPLKTGFSENTNRRMFACSSNSKEGVFSSLFHTTRSSAVYTCTHKFTRHHKVGEVDSACNSAAIHKRTYSIFLHQ